MAMSMANVVTTINTSVRGPNNLGSAICSCKHHVSGCFKNDNYYVGVINGQRGLKRKKKNKHIYLEL